MTLTGMTLTVVSKTSTDAEFLVVFNRLAVALREQQDASGITQVSQPLVFTVTASP